MNYAVVLAVMNGNRTSANQSRSSSQWSRQFNGNNNSSRSGLRHHRNRNRVFLRHSTSSILPLSSDEDIGAVDRYPSQYESHEVDQSNEDESYETYDGSNTSIGNAIPSLEVIGGTRRNTSRSRPNIVVRFFSRFFGTTQSIASELDTNINIPQAEACNVNTIDEPVNAYIDNEYDNEESIQHSSPRNENISRNNSNEDSVPPSNDDDGISTSERNREPKAKSLLYDPISRKYYCPDSSSSSTDSADESSEIQGPNYGTSLRPAFFRHRSL
jgi:hypothetical protein